MTGATRVLILESHFHQDMVDLCYSLREDGYWPAYFYRSVMEVGGVRAAKRLLHSANFSDGFLRLEAMGRLSSSIEAHSLLPWYRELFTDDELSVANSRLLAFGFNRHLSEWDRLTFPVWHSEL